MVAVVATGPSSIVEVTQPNRVLTAAEMDSMSPQERADAIEAGRARSWDDVPEPFRTEVLRTATALGAKLRAGG